MGKQVTIGGNRVGSGQKMQAELHNYFRSTHNLSEKWASSMGSGILYPAMCKLAMRGDTFDIKVDADCRTIPTVGPLFGSYKMQIDVYQCPVRLYQGILHNNPLAIGLNMAQVKFPMLTVSTRTKAGEGGRETAKMNNSCLLKYLGLSGLGTTTQFGSAGTIARKINAIPAIAYYDIFKTYYANKQEENAYVITKQAYEAEAGIRGAAQYNAENVYITSINIDNDYTYENFKDSTTKFKVFFNGDFEDILNNSGMGYCNILLEDTRDNPSPDYELELELNDLTKENEYEKSYGDFTVSVTAKANIEKKYVEITIRNKSYYTQLTFSVPDNSEQMTVYKELALQPFSLQNIDDMRYDLLSANRLGTAFEIKNDENVYLPYKTLVATDNYEVTINKAPLNGLVLKTYQNDIFNNWLNTDWIEGENGIAEMTKVAVVDGAFSIDSLSFGMKLYNMLNRIAVSGGTYEDWQDVVYEETKRRQIESPIFCGGISQEVVFDEIVQTAPSEAGGEESVLGNLGGRRRLANSKKGGRIHIKCDEACFIIAIVSLTPRIFQNQGNEFYLTDVTTMDDLHKPAMDGIGFQDLIGERMAWFDTKIQPNSNVPYYRSKIGKLPAWIEYMTSVDRSFGDFAEDGGKAFMILNRNYEFDEETKGIKDATTYIDPQKYNYAFAYDELEAQNFWVEINFDIKARRLMSARLIPNV